MNPHEYDQLLEGLGRPRVMIVGDLILDRYLFGDVSRISPEAPIPVLAATRAEERLGGAGNVAANLVAMEAAVEIVGVVGGEAWGRTLLDLLAGLGVDCSGCVIDSSRPTIHKTRMMSGSHQMLRVDEEDPRPVSGAALEALLTALPDRVRRARAVLLSDYGKGVLTQEVIETVIASARTAGVPVLVDPKGDDYTRYHGATLVTPNYRETQEAIGRKIKGIADLPAAADELMRIAGLEAAVITLGADGIYFKTRGGREGHVRTQARAVFDVTGAGDTVIAQLALYLADGLPLEHAVNLANQAAGIVVGRLGTHAVARSELRAVLNDGPRSESKIVLNGELDRLLASWRRECKRIVLTNGCFDILHPGHVQYLRFARAKGDALIVAVNDDDSVRRLKGPDRPVNSLADRMEILAAFEMVDAVTSFGEDTPARIIQRVMPHVLIKGEDWAEKGIVGREWVQAHSGQVVLAPLVPGKSTTAVLERVRAGAPAPAAGVSRG